jgi:hypothetical protein
MLNFTNIINKETGNFILGFIVACALWVIAITMYGASEQRQGTVYDCGMAEWHPDIPVEVKKACRERAREYQEQRIPKVGAGNVV